MGPDGSEASYALIVVHYRDPAAAHGLLRSASGWSVPPGVVVVVDNSGDFPEPAGVSGGRAPDVAVLRPASNLGYGGAVNRGLALARCLGFTYALVATQDCRLASTACEHLLSALRETEAAAVAGPLLTYSSAPGTVFSAGGKLTPYGRTLHPDQGAALADLRIRDPRVVDWLDGACLLVRVEALDSVGDFDERYFLYVEEVDLQFRLRLAGNVCLLVPRAMGSQEPGPYSLYYKYRNLCTFTARHRARLHLWPWYVALPKDSMRMVRQGRFSEPFWAIRGLVDWKRGRMGAQPSRIWAR